MSWYFLLFFPLNSIIFIKNILFLHEEQTCLLSWWLLYLKYKGKNKQDFLCRHFCFSKVICLIYIPTCRYFRISESRFTRVTKTYIFAVENMEVRRLANTLVSFSLSKLCIFSYPFLLTNVYCWKKKKNVNVSCYSVPSVVLWLLFLDF